MFPVSSPFWWLINQSGFAWHSASWIESDTEIWVVDDESEWNAEQDLPKNDVLYWLNIVDEMKNQILPAYQHPKWIGQIFLPAAHQIIRMEYSVPVH